MERGDVSMSPVQPSAKPVEPVKEPQTRAQVRAEIKRLSERLAKIDAQRHGGARDRSPVARMLDATPIEKKDPENHYCWVNTDAPGNVQTHLEEGYKEVPREECEAAGVRHKVGELVLMRIPRETFEDRVEDAKELASSRLEAYRQEFQAEVEGVVRELRDRGLSHHDIKRILVDEGS